MRVDAISAACLVVLATSVAGFAPVGVGVQRRAPTAPAASTCAVLQQHACSVVARVTAGSGCRAAVSPTPATCTPRLCAPALCAALPSDRFTGRRAGAFFRGRQTR
jgi:hypothetical protein